MPSIFKPVGSSRGYGSGYGDRYIGYYGNQPEDDLGCGYDGYTGGDLVYYGYGNGYSCGEGGGYGNGDSTPDLVNKRRRV